MKLGQAIYEKEQANSAAPGADAPKDDDVVDADPLTGGGVREQVLANAPAAQHGFFGVPKVIE